jgi:hypothetical protein
MAHSDFLAPMQEQLVTEKELLIALWDCQRYVSLLPSRNESDIIFHKILEISSRWVMQQRLDFMKSIDLKKEIMSGGPVRNAAQEAWREHLQNKKRA